VALVAGKTGFLGETTKEGGAPSSALWRESSDGAARWLGGSPCSFVGNTYRRISAASAWRHRQMAAIARAHDPAQVQPWILHRVLGASDVQSRVLCTHLCRYIACALSAPFPPAQNQCHLDGWGTSVEYLSVYVYAVHCPRIYRLAARRHRTAYKHMFISTYVHIDICSYRHMYIST